MHLTRRASTPHQCRLVLLVAEALSQHTSNGLYLEEASAGSARVHDAASKSCHIRVPPEATGSFLKVAAGELDRAASNLRRS